MKEMKNLVKIYFNVIKEHAKWKILHNHWMYGIKKNNIIISIQIVEKKVHLILLK